jgi:hypothetical protein
MVKVPSELNAPGWRDQYRTLRKRRPLRTPQVRGDGSVMLGVEAVGVKAYARAAKKDD